ncbi:hypothetical protein JOD27_003918 [Lentzea nigeriaca]|nr:hypothetical protein [Lentzea nigeriaca]
MTVRCEMPRPSGAGAVMRWTASITRL